MGHGLCGRDATCIIIFPMSVVGCVCDGDTLWLGSPKELFAFVEALPSSVVVAGSRDGAPGESGYCLGFAMLHMDRMRQLKTEKLVAGYIAEHGIPAWLEQDIFNAIFKNNQALLPVGWGASPIAGIRIAGMEQVKVVHYYGATPWPSSYCRRMMDIHELCRTITEGLCLM